MSAIRINLLPHRQLKRAQQQRLFVLLSVAVAALGALVVFVGHLLIDEAKNAQSQRNALLVQETAVLDKQIEEIKALKEKTQALLDRKKVVESLQTNRAESAHLFDELARRVPEGLFLKGLKQTGNEIILMGYAQSSARVSTFMRNLEASEWFESPNLVEVRSALLDKLKVSEFTLTAKQTKQAEGEQTKQAEGGKG